jgi:hypothetical protein
MSNKLDLEIGDIVWHKAYDFFGRVTEIAECFDDDSVFYAVHVGDVSKATQEWLTMHAYDITDIEGIRWIMTDEWIIKVNDFSEKTRLVLLMKEFKG